jgi:hypothetical protein
LLSLAPDRAATAELASALIWSPTPLDVASLVPPGTADAIALVVAAALDAPALEGVSPAEAFLLGPLPGSQVRSLALLAPGARVVSVSAQTVGSA